MVRYTIDKGRGRWKIRSYFSQLGCCSKKVVCFQKLGKHGQLTLLFCYISWFLPYFLLTAKHWSTALLKVFSLLLSLFMSLLTYGRCIQCGQSRQLALRAACSRSPWADTRPWPWCTSLPTGWFHLRNVPGRSARWNWKTPPRHTAPAHCWGRHLPVRWVNKWSSGINAWNWHIRKINAVHKHNVILTGGVTLPYQVEIVRHGKGKFLDVWGVRFRNYAGYRGVFFHRQLELRAAVFCHF